MQIMHLEYKTKRARMERPSCSSAKHSWFPKQRSTATSAPEAELFSAFRALKSMGVPFMIAMDFVTQLETKLMFEYDNESCIPIIKKSYSYGLTHVAKTQGIDMPLLRSSC